MKLYFTFTIEYYIPKQYPNTDINNIPFHEGMCVKYSKEARRLLTDTTDDSAHIIKDIHISEKSNGYILTTIDNNNSDKTINLYWLVPGINYKRI